MAISSDNSKHVDIFITLHYSTQQPTRQTEKKTKHILEAHSLPKKYKYAPRQHFNQSRE